MNMFIDGSMFKWW